MSAKNPINDFHSMTGTGDNATLPAGFFDLLERALAPVREAEDHASTAKGLTEVIQSLVQGGADNKLDLSSQITTRLKHQGKELAPSLKVRLLFWQMLFSQLEEVCPLDALLKAELQRMRPLFLITGLCDEHLATERSHPLRQLLENILQEGVFWYPGGGKESEQFSAALSKMIDTIAAADQPLDTLLASPAVTAFTTLLERQKNRAQMMEQRFSDSELGMVKINAAQRQVLALLEQLEGCMLPDSLLVFLRTSLRNELQYVLINHGDAASVWKSWSEIIKRLPEVFPRRAPAAEVESESESSTRHLLYSSAQVLLEWLNKTELVSAINQHNYDEGVEDLREHLFRRLRDDTSTLAEFETLAVPDELGAMGTTVSPALLKKVAHLRVGDWFLFSTNDHQWLRCKLLLRPPQVEQLVFVNRNGQRVLQKNITDFSACLATHIAKPLSVSDYFSSALATTIQKLLAWQKQTLARRMEVASRSSAADTEPAQLDDPIATAPDASTPDSSALKPAAVTLPADEETPVSIPATDRKSAAAKALQEARVLEQLALRRKRRASQTETLAASAPNFSGQPTHLIEQLNIGAWFDLAIEGYTELQRCKLVAIMRASDRFIFTDRLGVKVAEYAQAELIELMAADNGRVVSNGDDFESQLTKVVKTLRRDL